MNITKVDVWLVDESKLKAFVTIVIDNSFVVKDIKIIHGDKGLFVAMPNKKLKDGKFIDIAHPINQSSRKMIEDVVFAAYNKKVQEG